MGARRSCGRNFLLLNPSRHLTADRFRIIFLQIMKPATQRNAFALLSAVTKPLANSAETRVPGLPTKRSFGLPKRAARMSLFQCGVHVFKLARDRQLARELRNRTTRLDSLKGSMHGQFIVAERTFD